MFDSLKPCYVTPTFETKNHRLEYFAHVCDPQQRNPNAPKFEDQSQEETEWEERWAREAAGRLAKNILKLKEKHETAFFPPSENWCLPAPPATKLEERDLYIVKKDYSYLCMWMTSNWLERNKFLSDVESTKQRS